MGTIKFFKNVDDEIDISEAEIQKIFEENLGNLEEGLELISSFYPIPPAGEIDALAIDEDRRPVIIEFKKPKASEKDALIQSLDYWVWCRNNFDRLERYIRLKGVSIDENEPLNDNIRIMIVAQSFDDRIIRAASGVAGDIKLIAYHFFKGSEEQMGLIPEIIFDSSSMTSSKPPRPPESKEAAERRHLKNKDSMKPIYEKLKGEILELADNIVVNPHPLDYVAFGRKDGIQFCGCYIKRQHIRVHLPLMDLSKISEELTSEAPNSKWGYIRIRKQEDINEKLMSWIKIAYEQAKR